MEYRRGNNFISHGLFDFGWTIKYREFWVIPLIGTALFGFASMLVIGATVTYLVDSLPGKGATGVALNNLIRQILAAIATFIVEPLLRAIEQVFYLVLLLDIIGFFIGFVIFEETRSFFQRTL